MNAQGIAFNKKGSTTHIARSNQFQKELLVVGSVSRTTSHH